jgi:hypothetical protein
MMDARVKPAHDDKNCLLVPRIEIVARRCRRGNALGTGPMRTAAAARLEPLATITFKTRAAIDLRLRPGDE